MSLSVDDFVDSYLERELKEIKLESYKGRGDGYIFLRSLPYADICTFRRLSVSLMENRLVDIMADVDGSQERHDSKLKRAEDFLIKKAVCDSSGKLLFEDDKIFDKWRKHVDLSVVDEILEAIDNMNFAKIENHDAKVLADERKKK